MPPYTDVKVASHFEEFCQAREENGKQNGREETFGEKLKPQVETVQHPFHTPLPVACQSVTEYVTAGLHFRVALRWRWKKATEARVCTREKRATHAAAA